jgi:ribosome biogenesis GTPase A
MYMQRTTSGAADNGLYTTIKYMLGAANNGLSTTIKYLVNQTRARITTGPRPTYTKDGHDFC